MSFGKTPYPILLLVEPAVGVKFFCVVTPEIVTAVHGIRRDVHHRTLRYEYWRATVGPSASGKNRVSVSNSRIGSLWRMNAKALMGNRSLASSSYQVRRPLTLVYTAIHIFETFQLLQRRWLAA